MNKLDFMSLGKKAVQAYIYKAYGIALGLRDLIMSSYTNNSEGQIGKYRIEPWAKDQTLFQNVYQVNFVSANKKFQVFEWKVNDYDSFEPSYILATSQTIEDSIKKKH